MLCTIRIDEGLFDCRVLPQQGRDGAAGSCPAGAGWHQLGTTPLVSMRNDCGPSEEPVTS